MKTIRFQNEDDELIGSPEKFLGYTQYTKQTQHIIVDLDEEIQSANITAMFVISYWN